jgi:uncharacterized protein involved in exopolysaccharide biosynthesis
MEHLPVRQRPAENARQLTLDSSPALSAGYLEIDPADPSRDAWNRWLQYWNALTRHKAPILVAVLCGAVVAFGISLAQTPVYLAGATIEFQTQASQQQPLEGISARGSDDLFLVQTQAQLLTSGMLQDRVYAKMLQERDKNSLPGNATGGSVPAGDPLLSMRGWLGLSSTLPRREEAIGTAMAGLKITPVKDSRIVQISSQSTVPQVAADYVNTLVREFIQQNLEDRWSLYQATGTWLARAQQDLKIKLEESEQQLLTYARASGLVVTSKDEDIAEQKLIQVQAEVSRAQADRIARESVYRTAMAQPAESLAEVLDQGPMAQYQSKLGDLRRELADASTALMPEHPKVKRLEAQIEELESAKSRESGNILNRMRTDY